MQQALRPFPQYSGVSGNTLSGHSTYNALETSFEHRFSKGFYSSVSYTFSKLMNAVAGWNVYGDLTEKVISGSDRPHILAISYIYELPFGKGKPFLQPRAPGGERRFSATGSSPASSATRAALRSESAAARTSSAPATRAAAWSRASRC